MARNKINLKMQCMQKLDSLAAYGQKKDDKDVDRSDPSFNCNRSAKIHSYQTMKNYKNFASSFCDWMKDHHPDVKKIEQIETAHVKEYVESRYADGYSNYTLSAHVSCLNKVCNNESRDFWRLSDFGTQYQRRSEDITNNRGVRTDNHTDHYERNQSAILMASAFGIRRSSCENATCDQFIYKDGQIYSIGVWEKGGRYSEHPCLPEYVQQVNDYISNRISQYGEDCRICDDPDSHVNLHAYRAEYACSLYDSIRDNSSYYDEWRKHYVNEDALDKACSHPRYNSEFVHGYHTETVALVSQALGHNRISVVLNHYLHDDD